MLMRMHVVDGCIFVLLISAVYNGCVSGSVWNEGLNGQQSLTEDLSQNADSMFSAHGFQTHHLHRVRRSITTTAPNITFQLQKLGSWSSQTEIKVGNRIPFELMLTFTTDGSTDLKVEFLTQLIVYDSSNNSMAVLTICQPTVSHLGANIAGVTASQLVGIMLTTQGDGKYDRSVMDFGTVTRTGSGVVTAGDQINITFDAIVNSHPAFADGETYWVSAGAQYNNRKNVWLGQAVFYAKIDSLTSGLSPVLSLTGPSQLMVGRSGVWTLSLYLNNAVNDVIVQVFSPINISHVMSICDIRVGQTGEAYSCYAKSDAPNLTFPSIPGELIDGTHRMASLSLGSVVNSLFWESPSVSDRTIEVHIVAEFVNVSDLDTTGNTQYPLAVSVVIDESTVWTETSNVSATAYQEDSNSILPTVNLSTPKSHVTWGQSTALYVNITIPSNLTENYKVEVSLPVNGTAVLSTCNEAISVYYVGQNFPCWSYKNLTTTYESEVNDSTSYDYVTMDLGQVSNAALSNESADNTIVIRIAVKVTKNNTFVRSGEPVSSVAGLRLGATTLWIGSLDITVWDNSSDPSSQPPKMSVFNMMNNRDASILYSKGSSAFTVQVKLPFASYFPNLTVTVESFYIDGIPAMSVCNLSVWQVGRDLLETCQDNTQHVTASKKYRIPRTNRQVSGSMSLQIPQLGNSGYGNFWWSSNDSHIYLLVSVRDADHSLLQDKQFYWFNVTLDYGDSSNVLQQAVYVQYHSNSTPALSELDTPLQYQLIPSSNSTAQLRHSDVAKFDVNILTTPRTIQSLSVQALVNNTTLSVCRVAVKKRGVNLPCVYSYRTYYNTLYGAAVGESCHNQSCLTTQVDHAVLDLGQVANCGQIARTVTTEQDSLLTVEIAVKVRPNATIISGQTYSIVTGVYTGERQLWINDITVTTDTSQAALISNTSLMPVLSFHKMLNTSSQITKGGAAVYVLDLYIPPASVSSYRVEFFVPNNASVNTPAKCSVSEAKVITAGWNLPCVNDTEFLHEKMTFDNSTYCHNAVIDMELVTNTDLEDGTYSLQHQYNLIRAEAVVTVPEEGGASVGDQLWLAATVRVNDVAIWVSSSHFTVVGDILPEESVNETLEVNITETDPGAVVVGVGATKRYDVRIATDMLTTHYSLHVLTPHDTQQTYLTIRDMHVSHVGTNFPSDDNYTLQVSVDNSLTHRSSQDENITVNMGVITNTGTSRRYQFADYNYEDDVIVVTFDVVPSDHPSVTDNSVQTFHVDVIDSLGRTKRASSNITVQVTGNERPRLQIADFKLTEDESRRNFTDRTPGETVTVMLHFNHTDDSSQHADNVVIRFHVPDHLTYTAMSGFQFINPTVQFNTTQRTLSFHMTEVFFSDNETFAVNFTFDGSKSLPPGTGLVHLVLAADITYDGSGLYLYTNTSLLEFDSFVPDCSAPLGIEDQSLDDCQLTSSVTEFQADSARLNSDSGWKNQYRARPFDEYLQISFGNLTRVTALRLQPYVNDSNHVTVFSLKYSFEGSKWFDYVVKGTTSVKVFDLTSMYDTAQLTTLSSLLVSLTDGAIVARYVRLIPKQSMNGSKLLGLRLELYGCILTTDVPLSDVCKTEATLPVYERGYLMNPNDGTIYVCMVSNIDDDVKCSSTQDLGDTWVAAGDTVININMLQKDTNMLYGIARNQRSRIRSADGGDFWCAVTDEEYQEVEVNTTNIVKVKLLPFDNMPLNASMQHQDFGWTFNQTVKWSVDNDGVYVWTSASGQWKLVGYWFIDQW